MERFSISLDDDLARAFDELVALRGYGNRSEAVRDLIRAELEAQRQRDGEAPDCVASLSYVYNHHERDLAERLTHLQHEHHDLGVATMHAHLDHEHCIETTLLRGPTAEVRRFADAVTAERGVHHGKLNLIGVDVHAGHGDTHAHHDGDHPHGDSPHHFHIRPSR